MAKFKSFYNLLPINKLETFEEFPPNTRFSYADGRIFATTNELNAASDKLTNLKIKRSKLKEDSKERRLITKEIIVTFLEVKKLKNLIETIKSKKIDPNRKELPVVVEIRTGHINKFE